MYYVRVMIMTLGAGVNHRLLLLPFVNHCIVLKSPILFSIFLTNDVVV